MNSKQGRPKGTTTRAKTPPETLETATVRAIFPPSFPSEIGWMLYEIRAIRAIVKRLKKSKPDDRTTLDDLTDHRETLEREFETQCTVALLRGDSDFFAIVSRGVASVESFPKAKLAVADAWFYLSRWCGITKPTSGMIANHANSLTDELITASRARDYLKSMGMA